MGEVSSFKWSVSSEEEFTVKARRSLRGGDIGYLLLVIGGEKMSAVSGHWVEKEEAAFSSVILNLL
jgi:hypothetical protein